MHEWQRNTEEVRYLTVHNSTKIIMRQKHGESHAVVFSMFVYKLNTNVRLKPGLCCVGARKNQAWILTTASVPSVKPLNDLPLHQALT